MNIDDSARTIRCSNKSMYAKMEVFRDIIMRTPEQVRTQMKAFPDVAVLAEMTTMGTVSMRCDHCPTKHSHINAFERPIPNTAPSFIGDMNMSVTSNMRAYDKMNIRHNDVTAVIISDCISIIEFMQRLEHASEDIGTIVLATFPSVTHAASIACVFECISAYAGWNGLVSMIILTDEETRVAMDAYVGPRMNINLVTVDDRMMYLNQLMNMRGLGYMTMITHDETCSRMLMGANRRSDMDINVVMSLRTIEIERFVRTRCMELGMLMEACPCSNPKMNTVRIVPICTHGTAIDMTTRIVYDNTPIFGFMRYYTIMIRRMKVDGICYDCSIALKLARSMLYLMSNREIDMSEMKDKFWHEVFETTIDTKGLLE